jgi:hypothetical protein
MFKLHYLGIRSPATKKSVHIIRDINAFIAVFAKSANKILENVGESDR